MKLLAVLSALAFSANLSAIIPIAGTVDVSNTYKDGVREFYTYKKCSCMGEYGSIIINKDSNGKKFFGGCVGEESIEHITEDVYIGPNSMVCNGAKVEGSSKIENSIISGGNIRIQSSKISQSNVFIPRKQAGYLVRIESSDVTKTNVLPFENNPIWFTQSTIEESQFGKQANRRYKTVKSHQEDINQINFNKLMYFLSFENLSRGFDHRSSEWDEIKFSASMYVPFNAVNTGIFTNVSMTLESVVDDGAGNNDMSMANDIIQPCQLHLTYKEKDTLGAIDRTQYVPMTNPNLVTYKVGGGAFVKGELINLADIPADSIDVFSAKTRSSDSKSDVDNGYLMLSYPKVIKGSADLFPKYRDIHENQLRNLQSRANPNKKAIQFYKDMIQMMDDGAQGEFQNMRIKFIAKDRQEINYLAHNLKNMIHACHLLKKDGAL